MTTQKLQLRAYSEKTADGRLRIVATDETLDRSGESIPFESWDLTNFLKSPRLLIDHDYRVQAIVGKGINVEKDESRRAITFEPVFHDITQAAKETREMVEQGFLDTVSVGFLRNADEKGGEANELMEISFVAVPANPNARMLSVKGIQPAEEKAINAFLKSEKEAAAPQEGDACTMDDGTEGTMQMGEDGQLMCMLKKAPAEPMPAEEEPEEGGDMMDGCMQAIQKCQDAVKTAMEAKEDQAAAVDAAFEACRKEVEACINQGKSKAVAKGAVADELNKQSMWEQKWNNFKQLDAPISAAWRVYFNDDTEVEAFAGLVAEVVTLLKPLAGDAGATNSISEFMATDEGKEEAEKSMEAHDVKSGRVLSEKNRNIIKTARESMQSGIAALDDLLAATESSDEGEGEAKAKSETKGRKPRVRAEDDSFEKFVALRKVTRAVNAALNEALRDARLKQ